MGLWENGKSVTGLNAIYISFRLSLVKWISGMEGGVAADYGIALR